ncbi:uncharacterized protein LOC135117656 [Helicoverpa armigera]|uniref:uncharacterized protein LOC135117656 n=1 Tax=Helicoverpa armigera TaxID=29058 RepID=UPI003082C13E
MKSFSDDIIKRHTKTVGERNEVDEALTMLIFCQDVLGHNLLGPNWTFVIDLWFIILILFFCATSDSLVTMLKVEQDHDRSVQTEMEYMYRLNEVLKTFYNNHVQLMEYLAALKNMFKWSSLIPLVEVMIKWCLILLSVTEQIQWSFLANAMPAMLQILAYNWYGEQVRVKGSELTTALLEFDWRSMRIKDKKKYLFIISYMKKELKIKTAFGNDLSLVTMTSIFKASYQVYALLKSTQT